jgi:hypothetical protein
MFYALWDLESGKSLGNFDAESTALAVVRKLLEANGPDYAEMLGFGCKHDDGTFVVISDGNELAAHAMVAADSSLRSV